MLDLPALARRLASRNCGAEANIQGHIQTLLLYGGLNLGEDDLVTVEFEAQVSGGRRTDVEAGLTASEVKRDLRRGGAREEAEKQLAIYVRDRTRLLEQRYTGILTDGAAWHLYHLVDDELEQGGEGRQRCA